MCANRGKKRQNCDDDGSGHQPPFNGYSNYGNYAHQDGAEIYAGGGAGMSYGQQGGGPWSYDPSAQAGYYGLGTWGAGYGQGVYGHAGYGGVAYGGELQGYGHLHGGYSQQQMSGNYDTQQHFNGGYPNYYGQGATSGYGESPSDSANGANVDTGYSRYSTRPDSASYSNYRQGQNHKVHQQPSRGYTSAAPQRAGMPSESTTTPQSPRGSTSPRRTPPPPPLPPPPPRRTQPTEEYLSITQLPSSHVADPHSAPRKLVVLDLNGSLLLRSAHQRRAPQPRHGHGHGQHSRGAADDPYADPTRLRPLRAVHRRPYLGAFTAFILHEKTTAWLDTMVWSSAQPHSVDDMVDRCFGARRAELRAVWARDTLGLAADAYHRKSLTLKDLAKPWAELPYYHTSSSSTAAASSPSDATEPDAPEAQAQAQAQHHSALSTVLVDDSPLKATLQPWNHLVIPEYLQQTRNLDLKVVEWEEARERMEKTQRDIEALESAIGEPAAAVEVEDADPSDAPDHAAAGPDAGAPTASTSDAPTSTSDAPTPTPSATPTTSDTFIPNPKRKKKKLAQQEKVRREREAKERAAFAALRERQRAVLAERVALARANGQLPEGVGLEGRGVGLPDLDLDLDEGGGVGQGEGKAEAEAETEAEERGQGQGQTVVELVEVEMDLQAEAEADLQAEMDVEAEMEAGVQVHTGTTVQAEAKAEPGLKYDETLLAVVGVLDHLKRETNVSGWMRSGGLMRMHTALQRSSGESQASAIATAMDMDMDTDTDAMSAPMHPPTMKHDRDTPSPSRGSPSSSSSAHTSPPKKRRIGSSPTPTLALDLSTAIAPSSSSSEQTSNASPIGTEPPLSQISATSRSSPPPPSPPPARDEQEGQEEQEEQVETGVPLSAPAPTLTSTSTFTPTPTPTAPASTTTTKSPSATKHTAPAPSTTTSPAPPARTAGLWYEHAAVLAYWAGQGRRALAELGIAADSGMRTPLMRH